MGCERLVGFAAAGHAQSTLNIGHDFCCLE